MIMKCSRVRQAYIIEAVFSNFFVWGVSIGTMHNIHATLWKNCKVGSTRKLAPCHNKCVKICSGRQCNVTRRLAAWFLKLFWFVLKHIDLMVPDINEMKDDETTKERGMPRKSRFSS
jgi:hypothetical protein